MYISYNIIKELLAKPKDLSGKELAEVMTMAIVEVEGYVSEAEKWSQMVIGKVEVIKPHLNADKLKLVTVDLGQTKAEVVCGGVNLKEGMLVAFAHPGARVRWHGQGDWQILKVATIRGVESKGMICSAAEIGLQDSKEPEYGIMDLSYLKIKPGTPLAQALGKDDLILELDNKSITHRPDLWGHLGVARELAVLWKTQVILPKLADIKPDTEQIKDLKISIKEPDLCQRYIGVVVDNVKVEPSPAWLKNRVEALGMRSINNVVDIANYVMLEIGQPLHTFDLAKLASSHIIVRRAKQGEIFVSLDETERKLSADTLVIADSSRAQAIAGIIGGQSSEVISTTTKLLIESATFESRGIRKTSLALGLRTEASIRYEKAQDPELAEIGIKRFIYLLKTICPTIKITSPLVDEYPGKPLPVSIELSPSWIVERIGSKIKYEEIKKILESLGFEIWNKDKDAWMVKVPSWRATGDVTIPEDLIEEVARIYGYGNIKPVLPKFEIKPPPQDEYQDLRWKMRELLVGAGWTETLSYSFVGEKSMRGFGMLHNNHYITTKLCLTLVNPIDSEKNMLRPSLLPNLVQQVAGNLRWFDEVRLFEIGRIFINEAGNFTAKDKQTTKLPKQPYHLALLAVSKKGSDELIFREVKGILIELGLRLGLNFIFRQPTEINHDWYNKEVTLDIFVGKVLVGHLGILNSELISLYDLPINSVAVEISLDALPAVSKLLKYKSLYKYPGIIRDLSLVISNQVIWDDIASSLKDTSPLLESFELFDVYESAELGKGKRSIAFHLTFRHPKKTLKSEEVDKIVSKIKKILINKFNAEVRDH